MDYLVLVLRLIHIVSGVFWVGGSLLFTFFIVPTVAATADAGQKFMAHLVTKAKVSIRITIAAILTVLAGGWLYWIDSQGLTSPWQTSGPGIGFGIGGLAALVGLGLGMQVGRNATLLGKLAAQAKGQPSPQQMAQMKSVQKRTALFSGTSTAALIVALLCMATARYWLF